MPSDSINSSESWFTTMSRLLLEQSSEIVYFSKEVANLCSDETLKKVGLIPYQ